MKELNVIGTMQLLAACQKAPGRAPPRREVDLHRLRRQQPRPGDVHRGHASRGTRPAPATPRTSPRSRATSAASPAAGPTSLVTTLRLANVLGPHVDQPDDVVLPAAGHPDRARLRPAAAVRARDRPARGCSPTRSTREVPGTFNVAGDGVMLLSQAVRRLRKPTVALPRPAVGGLASLLKSARMADFSPEQLGFLTFGRGIDTTRMRDRARLRAGVLHRRGVRRLRRLDRPRAAARSSGSSTALAGDPCRSPTPGAGRG